MENEIDVSTIMKQIKMKASFEEKSERFQENCETVKTAQDIAHPYVQLYGINVSMYSKFGTVLSAIFRGIAKGIRKCTDWLFENQVLVNQNYEKSLNALNENQVILMNQVQYMNEQLETSKVKQEVLQNRIIELEKELALNGNRFTAEMKEK